MASLIKPPSIAKTAVAEVRHASLPIVALGVIIAILYFGRLFLVTAMTAVTIAFILEPFVAVLMRLRLPRSVASFVVCSLALLFLYVIGLGAYTQLTGLYGDLPKYGQRIADIVDGVQQKIQGLESDTVRMLVPTRQRLEEEERLRQAARKTRVSRTPPPAPVVPPPQNPAVPASAISDYISAHLNSFYHILLMISFIPFLVYFMLSWRDHINRSFLQLFQGEARGVAARSLEGIAEMVRGFVVGNFLLGFLMAIVSSSMFYFIQVPYPFLVGPLSGLLSLVPYIGLPLAMMPPLFAALGPNLVPTYVLVVVSVSLLHLIAMNLLYPKIVGSRVHLNPLVVTFSLMLWGFLWDAPGLLLAIPLTAGLKAVCDNVKELRPIGKFLGD
ncbi:MAG TPA: AI-2E family transporter [Bryobacteraceae bacterium]|nr:AI-2E family transporter [Bryobacteraceae bacterium]